MGSENTEQPEYQVGDGCLVDQLVGQYQAEICGLGDLLDAAKMRTALGSIYRYNYKRDLGGHESVQRVFAVNDEAALVICDYGRGKRPHIPFPYYAEVMTGFEYAAATHMIWAGMVREGVECIANVRKRYDGERRNPWNEAECGHHYARAMAAWSGVLALSGFRYHGGERAVEIKPVPTGAARTCFWSAGQGWGTFRRSPARFDLEVKAGELRVKRFDIPWSSATAKVQAGSTAVGCSVTRASGGIRRITLADEVTASPERPLRVLA
jgi:hypothetical protein